MKRSQLIAAGVLVAGLVAGAAWPPPPLPRTNANAETWNAPDPALERVPRELADAMNRLRWAGDAQQGDGEGGRQPWRLAGIVHTPQKLALIVAGEKKNLQNQRLEPGASLPDGSRLVSIGRDTILVEAEGCQRTFQVHRREPVSSSGQCADSNDTEQRKSQ